MKRRWWFLGLFAPQVVAQVKLPTGVGGAPPPTELELEIEIRQGIVKSGRRIGDEVVSLIYESIHEMRRRKPDNNECHRCGTTAKPFKWKPEDISPAEAIDTSKPLTSRITRCSHCSAAFWQDAEA